MDMDNIDKNAFPSYVVFLKVCTYEMALYISNVLPTFYSHTYVTYTSNKCLLVLP